MKGISAVRNRSGGVFFAEHGANGEIILTFEQ